VREASAELDRVQSEFKSCIIEIRIGFDLLDSRLSRRADFDG
jgi:hypothetical protein